jgi:hypothetical protein
MASSNFFYPMDMAPHTDFIDVVSSIAPISTLITATESISAVAFFALYFFITYEPSKIKTLSFYLSFFPIVPFLYWAFNFWTDHKMQLLWFSGGNLILAFAFWFSDWSMRDTAKEILTLHEYRYNYKKV